MQIFCTVALKNIEYNLRKPKLCRIAPFPPLNRIPRESLKAYWFSTTYVHLKSFGMNIRHLDPSIGGDSEWIVSLFINFCPILRGKITFYPCRALAFIHHTFSHKNTFGIGLSLSEPRVEGFQILRISKSCIIISFLSIKR